MQKNREKCVWKEWEKENLWKRKGREPDWQRERFGQAYEQRVTGQSLEVGKPTQEVSKSNLWEFAQQIVFRANTGA